MSLLPQSWLIDEWAQREQRRQQKQAVKFLRSVTLNITSSPVLQYSLIISKCSLPAAMHKKALMAVWHYMYIYC